MEKTRGSAFPTRLSLIHKKQILRRFSSKTSKGSEIRLRRLERKDREEIRELLQDTRNFAPSEIEVAISLVDEALEGESTYLFLVAIDQADTVLGYICYGRTPMTSGTWDVYWVAVLKRFQRRHIGSLLLSEVEKEIGLKEGRLIVIETSSKRGYYSTQRFYQKMGYHITARIVRFYSERDDKLIFCKYFTH